MKDENCSNKDCDVRAKNNFNKLQEYSNCKENEICRDKKEDTCIKDKDSKDCEYKEKKVECCCDTDKLRKILSVYKESELQSLLIITTNDMLNISLINDAAFLGLFIKDIKKDTVYLSVGSVNSPVKYIIPLNTIIFVSNIGSIQQDRFIEKIVNEKTGEKEKCCSSEGIAKAIKEAKNHFEDLEIAIDDIGSVIFRGGSVPVAIAQFIVLGLRVLFLVPNISISAVSDEILFASGMFENRIFNFVIPTCWVSGLMNEQGGTGGPSILDEKGRFNTSEKDTLVVTVDEDGNMVNLTEMGVDIKGKTMEEIMEIIKNSTE
ncbi:MAG: hypothetical protein GX275_03220 [Clostridiales bacterium]|nr:hypothetical protein [Clostridiales bacterium]